MSGTSQESTVAKAMAMDPGMAPSFRYHGLILSPERLRYSPHPDIIHPSVIDTSSLAGPPRARYYMYYAPHDAPGGICLAYAAEPEGPWHEYDSNPLIARAWLPHHDVSHVSSPHAIWNPEEQQLFLYYHGENDTTRFAVSHDGIHFQYGGTAVDAAMFGPGLSEASYARVFRRQTADSKGPYIMLLMGNDQGTRNIYLARSRDGRQWQPEKQPFMTPPPGTNQMGPGSLFEWNGQLFLLCFANREGTPRGDPISDLYLCRVNRTLDQVTSMTMILPHDAVGADNYRISDPCLLETPQRFYLFINVGRRLRQSIALAVADLPTADRHPLSSISALRPPLSQPFS